MNKDRIAGAAHQAAGTVKIVAGKAISDPKLRIEGEVEKLDGKIQSKVGEIKDALKR